MASVKINKVFLAATLLLALFVVVPGAAFADLVVTEIMYDLPVGSDFGREWIEVYNSGSVALDLTKFKLFENGTNHKIVGGSLPPGSYAVIADNPMKFKADWPQYSGALFDSTFALGNAGDTLELRDASSTVLNVTSFTSALGAAGDGNTLNRSPGVSTFTPKNPSPGASISEDVIRPKEKPAPAPKALSKNREVTPRGTEIPADEEVLETVAPTQVAAVTNAVTPAWHWWLAAGLLAFSSAAAIVFARRFAKDEWDIVEDTSE